jgi:NAD(P)-dependent dehydrogenase (short-subunit alcohol dehydrogenase family)
LPVQNGSVAGVRAGYTTSITYAAAKAAVVHLTTCVAMQLGESNVRVNCISPGGIATGIFGKALGLPLEAAEKSAEAMKAGLEKFQPIPRAASAALFLACDASSFINGHNLVVDGGRQWSVAQKAYQGIRQAFGIK